MEISFHSEADVIHLDEIARRFGVGIGALKEVIRDRKAPDYSLLGDQLVSNQVLETIQGELIGVTKHSDALKIFERYGIRAYGQAFSMLGYRVKWSGLDPEMQKFLRLSYEIVSTFFRMVHPAYLASDLCLFLLHL
jgi:hypothetical protein